jgi:mannobiose 2-epimerase
MEDRQEYLDAMRAHLLGGLLPFWDARIEEPRYGGFCTSYDEAGRPAAVRDKSLLCQARSLLALAHVARLGFPWPDVAAKLARGLRFLRRHFRDDRHGGWFWLVSEAGRPRDSAKVLYGHSFLLYGLAEHALLTGDAATRREAEELFDLIQERAWDPRHGGWLEHFDRRWRPVAVRPDGILHKSLDVHMHLLEAYTTLYELTGDPAHRKALVTAGDLIFRHLIDPATGTGIAMATRDWAPLPNVELGTVWGSDRFPPEGKPVEITSYGHDVELAWLYLHGQTILGVPWEEARPRVEPLFRHTLARGVDRRHGGLYVEGRRGGEVTDDTKEFWQQGEALVGFLDAYRLTGDPAYLEGFRLVHRFLFAHVIHPLGEWLPLVDREGRPLRTYLGHQWKVCYHTLRSTAGVVRRLAALAAPGRKGGEAAGGTGER